VEAVNATTGTLRKGDIVQVRSAAEIIATLDERGELDALPFMPEMVAMCGRRFTVAARTERICDTITAGSPRTMVDAVVLEGASCDGASHGGCAALCLLYWKDAWLRKVDQGPTYNGAGAAPGALATDETSRDSLLALASRNAKSGGDNGEPVRFRCQATQANEASTPISVKDPRSYVRAYSSGNVSAGRFVRVMAHAVVMESAKRLRLVSEPPLRGATPKSGRTPTLDLEPGEWVRIKTAEEIRATLNDKGKNRGLWFDREMMRLCGQVFRVSHRVDRLIDERTGEMIELSSDCVALEGATCSGEHSLGRWFCPRAIYPYWREGWLERVESAATVALPTAKATRAPTPV
jgi:hypothetical protein